MKTICALLLGLLQPHRLRQASFELLADPGAGAHQHVHHAVDLGRQRRDLLWEAATLGGCDVENRKGRARW